MPSEEALRAKTQRSLIDLLQTGTGARLGVRAVSFVSKMVRAIWKITSKPNSTPSKPPMLCGTSWAESRMTWSEPISPGNLPNLIGSSPHYDPTTPSTRTVSLKLSACYRECAGGDPCQLMLRRSPGRLNRFSTRRTNPPARPGTLPAAGRSSGFGCERLAPRRRRDSS